MELSHQGGVEAESLLRPDQRTAIVMPHGNKQGWEGEGEPFIRQEPVKLTPAWEGSDLPNDTLNLKGITMDTAPPPDKCGLIYLTMLLHGLGTLTAWNMFITAKDYYVEYKLPGSVYQADFLVYVGYASQLPNVGFSWFNVFFNLGGKLETRIIAALVIEVFLFVFSSILAMIDSSQWKDNFFWMTMVTLFIMNSCNAVYQNSVFGVGAKLPSRYTGALILGNNVCGTLVVFLSMLSKFIGDLRTAAIYYFIGGMFILLVCFDTFVALPLNRFYRYYDSLQSQTAPVQAAAGSGRGVCYIIRKSWVQLFNVWFTYFISLSLFPAVQSDVQSVTPKDPFLGSNFTLITCFLTFNLTACIGNVTANILKLPSRRYLAVMTLSRVVLVPLYLLSNYQPRGVVRTLPVFITDDKAYWIIAAIMGWTSGHASSLGMIYSSSNIEPEAAPKAGMLAGAMLITGIFTGIMASGLAPRIVSLKFWAFEL